MRKSERRHDESYPRLVGAPDDLGPVRKCSRCGIRRRRVPRPPFSLKRTVFRALGFHLLLLSCVLFWVMAISFAASLASLGAGGDPLFWGILMVISIVTGVSCFSDWTHS